MFNAPEIQEKTFEVGGLTWHIQSSPSFASAKFLETHENDQVLSKIASHVCGITGGDKHHVLDPEQARVVISKLTTPQLMELDLKLKEIVYYCKFG